MKRVEGWVEMEKRLNRPGGSTGFNTHRTFDPSLSIEQAREFMRLEQRAAPSSIEYRLVYVRVETTREVLD